MTVVLSIAVLVLFVLVLGMRSTIASMHERLRLLESDGAVQPHAYEATATPTTVLPAPPSAAERMDAIAAQAPPQDSEYTPPASFDEVHTPDPWRLTHASPRWTKFFAEHALSLAGGAFVLIAAVLFLTYAINAGWINETLRTVLAALVAIGCAGAAGRIAAQLPREERMGRAIGSLHGVLAGVAAATGAADVIVASRRYDVLDTTTAFVAMIVIGVATLATAIRWRSQDLAAFGLLGMLGASIFVDAPASVATLALVTVALLASLAAVVMMDWPRLAVVAAAVTGPQITTWAGVQHPVRDLSAVLAVTLGWWLLISAAVAVPALWQPFRARRTSVIGTCVAASFGAYGIFEYWMSRADDHTQRAAVVGSFAFVHLVVGLWLLARRRAELVGLAAALLSTAAALAAIAVFASAGDSARACSLVAEAVGVSALWWVARSRIAAASASALGLLALAQVLTNIPEPDLVWQQRPGWLVLIAPAVVLIGVLVAHRLSYLPPVAALLNTSDAEPDESSTADPSNARMVRRVLETLVWVDCWYIGFLVITQLLTPDHNGSSARLGMLTLAGWTIALALIILERATRTWRPELFALAAGGALLVPITLAEWFGDGVTTTLLLASASVVVLVAGQLRASHMAWTIATGWLLLWGAVSVVGHDGSPDHVLARGVHDPMVTLPLLVWLTAGLAATAVLAASAATADEDDARSGLPIWLRRTTAIAGVYVVSAAVVRAFTNPPGHIQQDAQVALSVTWALLGLAALAISISGPARLRSTPSLRIGAYVLLAVAALKVLALDTSQLETPFRVAVFLAVGMLLLVGARLEQLLRTRSV